MFLAFRQTTNVNGFIVEINACWGHQLAFSQNVLEPFRIADP